MITKTIETFLSNLTLHPKLSDLENHQLFILRTNPRYFESELAKAKKLSWISLEISSNDFFTTGMYYSLISAASVGFLTSFTVPLLMARKLSFSSLSKGLKLASVITPSFVILEVFQSLQKNRKMENEMVQFIKEYATEMSLEECKREVERMHSKTDIILKNLIERQERVAQLQETEKEEKINTRGEKAGQFHDVVSSEDIKRIVEDRKINFTFI